MKSNRYFEFSTLRRNRVADQCICCGNVALEASPAILMPFVADRALGWAPAAIDESWGLKTVKPSMAYTVCRSLQCDSCGLLFSDIRFADDEMNRLYRDYRGTDYKALREKYEPGHSLRNRALQGEVKYGESIDSFLAPFISKQAISILDYGSDSGKNTLFRHRARQHDIFDISNNAVVSGARAVSRKKAIENYYDLIVCSNVLEHVPYPSDLLEDIRRIMRPETVLYVEVPFEDVMRDYPGTAIAQKKHWHEHINFFSPSAVHSLLSNLGFKIKAFFTQRRLSL